MRQPRDEPDAFSARALMRLARVRCAPPLVAVNVPDGMGPACRERPDQHKRTRARAITYGVVAATATNDMLSTDR